MNRVEHLLVIAMEECSELSQEFSKRLRFGKGDCNPEDPKQTSIEDKITRELADLMALIQMLKQEGVLPEDSYAGYEKFNQMMQRKRRRVEEFLEYSKSRGTLT
jgi:NTP pyrophosphatase (non-canonical NTP hydrolase)